MKSILSTLGNLSLQFQKGNIFVFEILPAIEKAKSEIQESLGGKKSLSEIVKDAGNGITITLPTQTQELQPMAEHVTASLSCTCRQRHREETSQVVIECRLLKPGHKKRKVNNKEYVNLTFEKNGWSSAELFCYHPTPCRIVIA